MNKPNLNRPISLNDNLGFSYYFLITVEFYKCELKLMTLNKLTFNSSIGFYYR